MPKLCKQCEAFPVKPTYLYCPVCLIQVQREVRKWAAEQNKLPITYCGASGQETRQVSTHDLDLDEDAD